MPENKLSLRLNTILEKIPSCNCFADVGCDHALLSIEAVRLNKCKTAILTDVNRGPTETAKKNVLSSGISESRFDIRLGDGLATLTPNEADVIAICGMGGNLICDILNDGLNTAKTAELLILEPNTHWHDLREFLCKNGFKIVNETGLAEDNHPYIIIEAKFDDIKREMEDYYLGEFTPKLDKEYIKLLLKKSENVLKSTDSEFHKTICEKLRKLI